MKEGESIEQARFTDFEIGDLDLHELTIPVSINITNQNEASQK